MKITKYGHACLLVEDNGKRLLVDPGAFSFNDQFTPEQVGTVDVIVVTHSHQDHFMLEVIKAFNSLRPVSIIAGQEIRGLLEKEGLAAETIPQGQDHEAGGFVIKAFPAAHGPMPARAVENTAYLINGSLLHPGDSYATENLPRNPDILALPTQGPWSRLVDAVAFAKELHPKTALAIHDAISKEDFGTMMDGYLKQVLEPEGIIFTALKMGESIEV
jgi:L-ascorbate metabolism protein UlaG (beta-lactamase superfamily)